MTRGNASTWGPDSSEALQPTAHRKMSQGEGFGQMDFLKDLWGFLRVRKKFWLLPIILFLLLFGVLIVLTGGSAIAPFIYAVF